MSQSEKPAVSDPLSGDFFQTIVDGLPEALIVSSRTGEIIYTNAALETLLGYQAAEIGGESILKLVPHQPGRRADAIKWLARWSTEPLEEQSRYLDLIARTKAGREMPVDVRVVKALLTQQECFLITVRDNSAHRREATRNKEELLRLSRILAVADDAIVSVNEDQKITFFNLSAEKMFGYTAEEILGTPLEQLMPKRFASRHHLEVKAFASGKQASRFMGQRDTIVGVRKDGSEFPIEATITKVDVHGATTFTAHVRDVTVSKVRDAALKESQQRFQAIFDHAVEAIGLCDPQGKVLEINRAGRALVEDEDAGLVGRPLWELPWIGGAIGGEIGNGADADQAGQGQLEEAVKKAAKGETVRFTVEVARPAGNIGIDISLVPIYNADGEVVYILPEGRDVHVGGEDGPS